MEGEENLAVGLDAKPRTGLLPDTAGRRRVKENRGERKRTHARTGMEENQIKSSQSVAAKSIQRGSLVSGSRGEMCAKRLRNTSARITSPGLRLHTGMW